MLICPSPVSRRLISWTTSIRDRFRRRPLREENREENLQLATQNEENNLCVEEDPPSEEDPPVEERVVPFELLNLPEVLIRKCICLMDLKLTVALIRESERCAELARTLIFDTTDISLDDSIASISIKSCPQGVETLLTGDYVEDHKIMDRILYVFRHPLRCVKLTTLNNFEAKYRWLEEKHEPLQSLIIYCEPKSLRDYTSGNVATSTIKLIFDGELHITKRLLVYMVTRPMFSYPPDLSFRKQPQEMMLKYSNWLTIDQLMNCACQSTIINFSIYGNQEVNRLLRTMKNLENPNLNRLSDLSLTILNANFDAIIEGLDGERSEEPMQYYINKPIGDTDNDIRHRKGAIKFKRNDGMLVDLWMYYTPFGNVYKMYCYLHEQYVINYERSENR